MFFSLSIAATERHFYGDITVSNFYFGLMAALGAVALCLCLVVLIPQGMWMYLLGLIWGTGVLTWSMLNLRGV